MKINNIYPKISDNLKRKTNIRKILLLISLINSIICIVVNLSVGGQLWFLYVIGGLIIIYFLFSNSLIENTFMKRFTLIIFVICGYLYLIDLINKTHWSKFVIMIILFSVLILQAGVFFSFFKKQKKEIIPIFFTSLFGLVVIFLALVGAIEIIWPIIVLGSLGLTIFIIFFTVIRKYVFSELKKYFYTK